MRLELDEIVEIFPKLILWNKFPETLDEEIIIKFLKNDYFLLEFNLNEIIDKTNQNIFALIFNLDYILYNNEASYEEILDKAEKLIQHILEIYKFKVYAFSSYNSHEIKNLFLKSHIKYFEIQDNTKKKTIDIDQG